MFIYKSHPDWYKASYKGVYGYGTTYANAINDCLRQVFTNRNTHEIE